MSILFLYTYVHHVVCVLSCCCSQSLSSLSDHSVLLFCVVQLVYVFCIYLDVVASNYVTNRWNTELSEEQKASPSPDIVHDNFQILDAEHIIHELLRELPLVLLGCVLVFGFVLPYDVLGRRCSTESSSTYTNKEEMDEYRRFEACTRYFETRCVLEVMRALSVSVTSTADPHGLHCRNIEAHSIDNIFTTFTFARCGDNLYSGHVSQLLSLALTIQTYMISRQKRMIRYVLSIILWIAVLVVGAYVVISRMHYSVDVLISFFLCITTWLSWSNVSWPTPQKDLRERRGSSFKACKNSFLDLVEGTIES